jgi:hypothetical protein
MNAVTVTGSIDSDISVELLHCRLGERLFGDEDVG